MPLSLPGMGAEIAVPVFGPLIAIGIAILLYLTVSGRKAVVTGSSKLGLGRSRLAPGYVGALIVVAIYRYVKHRERGVNAANECLKGACHCGAVRFTAKLTEGSRTGRRDAAAQRQRRNCDCPGANLVLEAGQRCCPAPR